MPKALKDMTLEELWELFPIVLVPHDPRWTDWAKEEIAILSDLLQEVNATITHIGSTAIPNIQSKPIIDILVEIPSDRDMMAIRRLMESSGYIWMSVSDSRMSFNKGYTPEGYAEKVFHIHIHMAGDRDEIFFRDYLISHPDAAKEYEHLKLSLLPLYKHDRDAYTAAKTDFVRAIRDICRSVILQDP